MATKVVMEALSPTMEEGRLVRWLKNEGDTIASGDVLAEVETDKAVMELVARGDGVLRKRLAAEGDASPVGTLLAVIAGADENIDALTGSAAPASPAAPAAPAATAPAATAPAAAPADEPAAAAPVPQAPGKRPAPQRPGAAPAGRARSSPLARRIASERGIELSAIHGSGPGGRITKKDVESANVAPRSSGLQRARPAEDFIDVPLTQIRKTIAKRLAESIGPVPTFYLTAEFDMGRAAELRTALSEIGDEYKASFNDIVIRSCALALTEHPEVNAHWLGDKIRKFNRVHVAMAVAVEEGLITPVIFDTDQKTLQEISREAKELAGLARERKLTPEQYTGSTFSVSNLGMFGIEHFTAIINPPEAGILAVGAVEEKAIVMEGVVSVRQRMRITMSCDHRVIDGATGAKFLQTLRRYIENPLLLVM